MLNKLLLFKLLTQFDACIRQITMTYVDFSWCERATGGVGVHSQCGQLISDVN